MNGDEAREAIRLMNEAMAERLPRLRAHFDGAWHAIRYANGTPILGQRDPRLGWTRCGRAFAHFREPIRKLGRKQPVTCPACLATL